MYVIQARDAATAAIALWDAHTLTPAGTLAGHESTVACLAFAPGDGYLASAGKDRTLCIHAATGDDTQVKHSLRPLRRHAYLTILSRLRDPPVVVRSRTFWRLRSLPRTSASCGRARGRPTAGAWPQGRVTARASSGP